MQTVVLGSGKRCKAKCKFQRHAGGNGNSDTVVNRAFAVDAVYVPVVCCETAAGCSLRGDDFCKGCDVLCSISFAKEDVLAKQQFFPCFLCGCAFVVACDTAGDVLAQRLAGQSRGMSVDSCKQGKFCGYFRIAEENARDVHHFAETKHLWVFGVAFQVLCGDNSTADICRRCRNTGRHHEEDVSRRVLCI